MYFIRGNLPWQGLKAPTKKQKYEKISEKKIGTPIEQLCKGAPNEFVQYLNYCRCIHFEDKPDYKYLRKLFRDLFVKEGFKYDAMYDWTILKSQRDDKMQITSTTTMEEKEKEINTTTEENIGSRVRSGTEDPPKVEQGSETDEPKRTGSSSKLVERKSATFRKTDGTGSGNGDGKVSSSFIKLKKSKDKDEGSNGKPEQHTTSRTPTSAVRSFLSKNKISSSKPKNGKEET